MTDSRWHGFLDNRINELAYRFDKWNTNADSRRRKLSAECREGVIEA